MLHFSSHPPPRYSEEPILRLAAWQDGRLTLFEADSNPAAHVGGDLLDISGKVQYIGINSEQDGITELAAIKNEPDVDTLVGAVVKAPVNQQLTDHSGTRYLVALHLKDGTAVVRAYWPGTGDVSRLAKLGLTPPQATALRLLDFNDLIKRSGAVPLDPRRLTLRKPISAS